MDIVDVEMDEPAPESQHDSFGENQVGSVTLTLEPVHTSSPLNWVAEQFQARPELFALPVEKDGGVVGVVTRARILERSGKFLENLSSRPLDQDLSPHQSLDARESVDKVVSQLFADDSQALATLFVVYLHGAYYGVTDLRRLVSRSAKLRDQDLARAKEVQEGSLGRSRLPETPWQRATLVRMAYGVGGDFYQEVGWPDGTCLMGCFDVSGKGISGSMVTSALAGFFSAVRTEEGGAPALDRFALRLNDFLREILPLGTFVTGVLLSLAASPTPTSTMDILNFGYGPVYWYSRKENKVTGKAMRPNLPPLGLDALQVEDGAVFRLPWEPGTKVYVFSDGLTDLTNPSGHRYGEEALREFLSRSYKYNSQEFVTQLALTVDAWQGSSPQVDDITALTVQA